MLSQRNKVKRLHEERDRLVAEIEAKKHELVGLERAIALLQEGEDSADGLSKRRRTAIKDIVLRLLESHKEAGLTAVEVVEVAKAQGHELERGSVSSLLSRLKKDSVLGLDSGTSKYRLLAATDDSSLQLTPATAVLGLSTAPATASVTQGSPVRGPLKGTAGFRPTATVLSDRRN